MQRWPFETERVIHSIKIAFACLVGIVLIHFSPFQGNQWLVITIFVVMCAQVNVGSVIQKSSMRFLGTFTGSLVALLTISLFHQNIIAISAVVALSGMVFSYIATSQKSYSDAGTLGAVTVAIILIGPHPSYFTTVERFVEISIGIFIAAVVSQFILPIHATTHLRYSQANTLRQLRDYYDSILLNDTTVITVYHELDEALAKALVSQRKLAAEAKREHFGDPFDVDHFNQLLWSEKQIFRCITFMHLAYLTSPETRNLFSDIAVIKRFHQQTCEALGKIATALEHKTSLTEDIVPRIESLKEEALVAIQPLSSEDKIHAYSALFCIEELAKQLRKIVKMQLV